MNAKRCSLMALGVAFVVTGCGSGQAGPSLPSDQVLGFEVAAGWTSSAGGASATVVRTQGSAAYELTDADNDTTLTSSPVASTAAALGALADPDAQLELDVMLPAQLRDPHNAGSLEVFARCPSRGVSNASLGKINFAGQRLGIFTTMKLAIPPAVRQALAGGAFTDLTFELMLHAPGDPKVAVKYLFDNLRVISPSTPPAGAGQSADLVARLAYAPAQSTPGEVTFPVGAVQVPRSFHLKLGKAGNGTAKLELGFAAKARVTCTYGADAGGSSYSLTSCTGGVQAGDLLGADYARLTIVGGDPTAGPTKIRAQIAINPVGDEVGGGIIPPMPTFWGSTASDASTIATNYFNAVNATKPTEQTFVTTPIPEFARRHGDGTPHDDLTSPYPPPGDPPFDKEGHLNPGGTWDAYYRLTGNLSADNTANHNKTHFEATLSANAVLWGKHVTVASVHATADTDNGLVDPNGFHNPTASGSAHMYLFGVELPGGGSVSPSTGFKYDISKTVTKDLPPIHIWIFSVTLGVNATVALKASGTLSPAGFNIDVVPEASIGAHVFGGVDVGIASGGVDVTVKLIDLQTPMVAQTSWVVSTNPEVCNGSLTFLLDGKVVLSSLGGRIDLKAKFGVCPLCYKHRWNIYKWDPLASTTHSLFHFTTKNKLFPLPLSSCQTPLQVDITKPADGTTVTAGVPLDLTGTAIRPSTAGTFQSTIDCSYFKWSTTDSNAAGFGATGCKPVVTFDTLGTQTVTLSVTDKYGEKGTASIDVKVLPPPSKLTAFIDQPASDLTTYGADPISLHGGAIGGSGPYSFSWSVSSNSGTKSLGTGQSATLTFPDPFAKQTFVVTLTVKDSHGTTATTTRTITKDVIQ